MDSLSKILSTYINLLTKISTEKNLYVLETQANFKLSIFCCGSLDGDGIFNYFEMADIAKNETYYFLLKDRLKRNNKDILEVFPILDLDPSDFSNFLSKKTLSKVKSDMIESVNNCYDILYGDNMEKIKERKEFMLNSFECIFKML